jgi:hypothetical protein
MSTEQTPPDRDAEVIPLKAIDAGTEGELADTPAPAYVDTSQDPRLRPLVAEPWLRHNLRATLRRHAGCSGTGPATTSTGPTSTQARPPDTRSAASGTPAGASASG